MKKETWGKVKIQRPILTEKTQGLVAASQKEFKLPPLV